MSRFVILISALLLIFSAGCAKKRVYSTPPVKHHKFQKQDSPDTVKPVLKTDPYTVLGQSYVPHLSSKGYKAQGLASWYGDDFHGKSTANGETYNMYAMTAAHRTLPMGSMLEVTDRDSGRKVIVRVNDRGPFADPDLRIIDLSYAAASKLGIINKGLTPVELRAIDDVNVEPVTDTEIVSDTAAPSEETVVSKTVEAAPEVEEIIITEAATAQEHYFIQVGSFTEHDRATAILESLRAQGYNESRMVEVSVNGKKYMRVQAGYFYNIPEAEDAMNSLASEFGEMFIVTQ
ncbi:septal ring lytic transglycosylase RlpA family protein [Maridesulfovibrio hydrothermalis]|uniref:Probable endolytic peptidoglycan transglycosylase RlpA n=1 Tax=Maridesulfovibrio hydrothermalis AM13 = DSM 14728 TaxID=1121451 RepID=L0RA64_9BACT|nr:septal ring lytic transglycosylase RlpA family protein [Maridesulfovibrio hydrothermalis]CCO23107.1 Rare lipoprotein A [Maridesulfovibrio hydrothermalis AM13 = DSM 14728]